MLRFLLRAVISLLVLLVIVAGVALYLLQDPNRFKPELVKIIEAQTGVPVRIDGDLSWKLFPPISLSAQKISADYEGTEYTLGSLILDVNLMSVIQTQDIDQWQIKALQLKDLHLRQEADETHLKHLRLRDFKPGVASPFDAELTYRSGDEPAIPLKVEGHIAYFMDANRLQLNNTHFETTDASGVCDLQATLKDSNQTNVDTGGGDGVVGDGVVGDDSAIIPLEVWRGIDWEGDCLLDRLQIEDEDFHDVAIALRNSGGNSTTEMLIPDFFGGSAGAEIAIDASRTPVQWVIVPDLQRADSQALMSWLDQRLRWIAALAYSGEITMTGNTEEELINSIRGTTVFDGGRGKIDIAQIKQPLLNLARLFKEGERIASWPDMWPYERLLGEWQINGKEHAIDLSLDNLVAALNGTYDPLTDELDMKVEVMFEDLPDMHSFDVNPLIVGLPIPLNCRGTLEAPDCRIDAAATRELVATVLASEQGEEILEELDRKIDEEVPEEYREAAKGLLDLLGGALKKKSRKD